MSSYDSYFAVHDAGLRLTTFTSPTGGAVVGLNIDLKE